VLHSVIQTCVDITPPSASRKLPGGTRGKSGEIWRKIVIPYSQEAKYGAVFGETDRNMEINMEANMASLGVESMGLILFVGS